MGSQGACRPVESWRAAIPAFESRGVAGGPLVPLSDRLAFRAHLCCPPRTLALLDLRARDLLLINPCHAALYLMTISHMSVRLRSLPTLPGRAPTPLPTAPSRPALLDLSEAGV